MSATGCIPAVEDLFGPVVASSCLDGFDFTLLFEESLLTILPLSIALLLAPVQLYLLLKEEVKVKNSCLVPCKLLSYLAYIALQIVLLVLWTPQDIAKTRATLAAVALSLVSFIIFAWLSFWGHQRSLRPSSLLTVYLGLSTLLDLARARTLFFFSSGHTIASVFLTSYCVKVVIFGLELLEKRDLIVGHWKEAGSEDTASTYRRALFLWLNRLFAKGYRTLLSVKTLPKIDFDILSASEPDALKAKWTRVNKSSKHALLWEFLFHYKWTVLAACLPRLAYTGFTFAQPFLIDEVLSFTSSPPEKSSPNDAYGLIGAYAIVYIGAAVSLTLYEHKAYRTLSKFRGSLINMIYEKTLRLSSSSTSDAEAITLISADIDRLGIAAQDIHELYASTLEVGLCLWLLYVYLGVAAAAVAGFNVLCLALSVPVATAAGKAQVPWLDVIETRLTETAHTLGNIKLIRMTGLTDRVSSVLRTLRISEIAAARRYRILNVFISILYYLSYAFSPVWGFGVYILVARGNDSGTLLESTAFGAQAIFSLLNKPTVMVIDAIEHAQTVIECFGRMQEYLTREEQEPYRALASRKESGPDDSSSEKTIELKNLISSRNDSLATAAVMRNVSLRYSPEQKPVLRELNLDLPGFQTTVILGPVGSGKSTLLRLLLGETPEPENEFYTNFTKAAYCSQQPWISKATIRENIVGMSPWDEKWYNQVLQACALVSDINDLPNGEHTEAGMRGSSLSGGQRNRVSLARALYSKEPVLLLDDVLSGLDPVTEQIVSTNVFSSTGLVKRCKSTVIMASSSAEHLRFADYVVILEKGGRLGQAAPANSISPIAPIVATDDESESPQTSKPKQEAAEMKLPDLGIPDPEDDAAASSRQKGDYHAYAYYSQIAGWQNICIWLFFSSVFMFGLNFPTVWLQWWVNANADEPNNRVGYWLGVYFALACLAILANIISDCMVQLVIVPKTSAGFHELLLSTTTRAKNAFLTATHGGAILNRFSQDLELIDSDLPGSLDKTLFSVLQTIFTTVLVFVGSGYLSCALPACLLVVYGIQHFYLRTSRQLRHVDIESKEPLFSHFLDTVTSVDSIRAYGWQKEYKQRNLDALNTSQPPYYLMWTIQRWLTLVLNLFVAGLAILLVALATNIQNGSTAFLGTALSNIVNFGTTLQLLVTDWTQLETAICAVSRIKTYVTEVEPEEDHNDQALSPLNWPTEGNIVFEGVTASYPSQPKPVLQNINITISAGEKVAVCGRTGSGKSTFMSTLLRMVDLDSGKIVIDGTDIKTISRDTVRRCLTSMPQETFFITGTIRQNLDPLHLSNDESLITILDELALHDMLDEAGGLDSDLSDEMLSSGQQQLFCLARAIVRDGPIFLLDEATSSVDSVTSDLMQKTLRKSFGKKTVIAIAHHLDTILDFDRVIVLDKGEIIESGNPKELLELPGSAFKLLSDSMNDSMSSPSSQPSDS